MLADAEEIDADLVRKNPLIDDVPDHLRVRQKFAVRSARYVAEGVEAEFESLGHAKIRSNRIRVPFQETNMRDAGLGNGEAARFRRM
jgi:hypothetical protein